MAAQHSSRSSMMASIVAAIQSRNAMPPKGGASGLSAPEIHSMANHLLASPYKLPTP